MQKLESTVPTIETCIMWYYILFALHTNTFHIIPIIDNISQITLYTGYM